jgi:hypothetical protein
MKCTTELTINSVRAGGRLPVMVAAIFVRRNYRGLPPARLKSMSSFDRFFPGILLMFSEVPAGGFMSSFVRFCDAEKAGS